MEPKTNLIATIADATGLPAPVANSAKAVGQLINYYTQNSREQRSQQFIKCLDLRYEVLGADKMQELLSFMESPEGRDILEQATEAVTSSVSKLIPMVMALILLNDPDYDLSPESKVNIINGISGASDSLIEFYIELMELPVGKKVDPYDQYIFGSYHGLQGVFIKYTPENIFSFVQQLINRALLLPNPQVESGMLLQGDGKGWIVKFGISSDQRKTMGLFAKAKALSSTIPG